MSNLYSKSAKGPEIVVSLGLAYGGLVQLLAGMWQVLFQFTRGLVRKPTILPSLPMVIPLELPF